MIAAVLHDVVEDTDWTIDRLRREGFSETVLAAIDCLTRRDGETYEEFIERAAVNPVARRVKLADLEDNMDIRRIRMLGPNAHDRLARYHVQRAQSHGAHEDIKVGPQSWSELFALRISVLSVRPRLTLSCDTPNAPRVT
jgi:hypothetical protein